MYQEKEVLAGIALLDERKPGWMDRIRVDHLDLGNTLLCVLGQVFGEYTQGMFVLGVADEDEAEHYGFQIPATGAYSDYHRLTETWKAHLSERGIKPQPTEAEKVIERWTHTFKLVEPTPMPVLPVEIVDLDLSNRDTVASLIASAFGITVSEIGHPPTVEIIDERELVLV